MKKILTMLLVGAMSMSANSANWVDLGKSGNNNLQVFLDASSIKPYTKDYLYRSGNYKSAFVQYTYINNHENRKKGWYYQKTFTIVNCNEKSMYSPSGVIYGFKDQVIDSFNTNYFSQNDFNIVFPETIGQSIVDSICGIGDYQRPPRIAIEDLI